MPEETYTIPLGLAAIKRPGTDVTVVAIQAMVPRALQAATRLDGTASPEVIDPRTLAARRRDDRRVGRAHQPPGRRP